MKFLLIVGFALALAGCTNFSAQPDPSRFFTLSALSQGEEGAEKHPAQAPNLSFGIGPVSLPGYLDRQEIVTRIAQNQIRLSDVRSLGRAARRKHRPRGVAECSKYFTRRADHKLSVADRQEAALSSGTRDAAIRNQQLPGSALGGTLDGAQHGKKRFRPLSRYPAVAAGARPLHRRFRCRAERGVERSEPADCGRDREHGQQRQMTVSDKILDVSKRVPLKR